MKISFTLHLDARQLQRAVDATKQRLPELLLKHLDLAADRRLCHAQLMSRSREVEVPRRRMEPSKQIQRNARAAVLLHDRK